MDREETLRRLVDADNRNAGAEYELSQIYTGEMKQRHLQRAANLGHYAAIIESRDLVAAARHFAGIQLAGLFEDMGFRPRAEAELKRLNTPEAFAQLRRMKQADEVQLDLATTRCRSETHMFNIGVSCAVLSVLQIILGIWF